MGLENLKLIQGGMAIGVSGWKLASEVAKARPGETMGVIAGTGAEFVMARILQLGDPDGHMRRALFAFPDQEIAQRILDKYFIEEGKPNNQKFKTIPMFDLTPSEVTLSPDNLSSKIQVEGPREVTELIITANFAQVWLAKQGHEGLVGINLLAKVELPLLSALYGAMLAGVDAVLMGAGIPIQIPGILDKLSKYKETTYRLDVEDSKRTWELIFIPRDVVKNTGADPLKRPAFLPIVSTDATAKAIQARVEGEKPGTVGEIQGIVVEGPGAGGHSAKPRGNKAIFNRHHEPVYGKKDKVNIVNMNNMKMSNGEKLPYFLADGYGTPDKFKEALELGAQGIQVGTLFALCKESGIVDHLKKILRTKIFKRKLEVRNNPVASPSKYPFKEVLLKKTITDGLVYKNRLRICDIRRLAQLYEKRIMKEGSEEMTVLLKSRCPAEPIEAFLQKGGSLKLAVACQCLCNGLLATVGLGQPRGGSVESASVTLGKDVASVRILLNKRVRRRQNFTYGAKDAVNHLFSKVNRKLRMAA